METLTKIIAAVTAACGAQGFLGACHLYHRFLVSTGRGKPVRTEQSAELD